ncbi:MAG: leucine-rich repeat domain-containing protein [Gemmatimonadetes bacterium]|nr:leucine-rich repeat domain-containing protein [Gemmatimonadota bacterium]
MKSFGVTSVVLLTLVLTSPAAVGAQVLQPGELCGDNADVAIAMFEDANLEARVRAALSVGAQDDLTCGLVSGLTRLAAAQAGIGSLAGIQNLTGLTDLGLGTNSITDISALSGLTSLERLRLDSNSITDINPLSGLTSLTNLSLTNNPNLADISPLSGLTSLTSLGLVGSITDISPLSGLTSLTSLFLSRNSITDISVLSGLTSLTNLDLGSNSISDISALSGLTSLADLSLDSNRDLTNIQPLLDNAGLDAFAEVDLTNTNVSCMGVAALQAKGARVSSSGCPANVPFITTNPTLERLTVPAELLPEGCRLASQGGFPFSDPMDSNPVITNDPQVIGLLAGFILDDDAELRARLEAVTDGTESRLLQEWMREQPARIEAVYTAAYLVEDDREMMVWALLFKEGEDHQQTEGRRTMFGANKAQRLTRESMVITVWTAGEDTSCYDAIRRFLEQIE